MRSLSLPSFSPSPPPREERVGVRRHPCSELKSPHPSPLPVWAGRGGRGRLASRTHPTPPDACGKLVQSRSENVVAGVPPAVKVGSLPSGKNHSLGRIVPLDKFDSRQRFFRRAEQAELIDRRSRIYRKEIDSGTGHFAGGFGSGFHPAQVSGPTTPSVAAGRNRRGWGDGCRVRVAGDGMSGAGGCGWRGRRSGSKRAVIFCRLCR